MASRSSRMLSTPLFDAASISCTSTLVPAVISLHASHTLHGAAVGALTHERHLARMRAAVVLPTPRAPVERKKVAPGTRAANYRCFLPDLAGFVSFASPRAAYRLAHNEQRRERDSNP